MGLCVHLEERVLVQYLEKTAVELLNWNRRMFGNLFHCKKRAWLTWAECRKHWMREGTEGCWRLKHK